MALSRTGEYKDETQTVGAIDKFKSARGDTTYPVPDTTMPTTWGADNYSPGEDPRRTMGPEGTGLMDDSVPVPNTTPPPSYDAGGEGLVIDRSGQEVDAPVPPTESRQREDDYYNDAEGIGPDGYNIDSPDAAVTNREVGQEEMAGYQLGELTNKNSEWSQRAMQSGKDFAASRGLMNSSIAGGNAYGAWLDRAAPIAMDQAKAYQGTASENMAATNAGGLQDANNELQANLAETGYDAKRDQDLRDAKLRGADDERRADIGIENREDTQQYTTGEREAIELFQKGERIDSENFTTSEREAIERWQTDERLSSQGFTTSERWAIQEFQSGERIDSQKFTSSERKAIERWQTQERIDTQGYNTSEREAIEAFTQGERIDTQNFTDEQRLATEYFQWNLAKLDEKVKMADISSRDKQSYLQAWSMVEMGKFQSIGAAGAAIYGNTKLKAHEQQAAIANMIAFFNGIAPDLPDQGGAAPGDPDPTDPSQPAPTNPGPPIVGPIQEPDPNNPSQPAPTNPVIIPPAGADPYDPLPSSYDFGGLMG